MTYEKDGVYLTVYRPADFLSRVNELDLIKQINKRKLRIIMLLLFQKQ